MMLLLFKIVMPWLKANEEEDRDAQDKFEKEMEEKRFSCAVVVQWCGNAVCGLPRFVRGQLNETLWWFDAGQNKYGES